MATEPKHLQIDTHFVRKKREAVVRVLLSRKLRLNLIDTCYEKRPLKDISTERELYTMEQQVENSSGFRKDSPMTVAVKLPCSSSSTRHSVWKNREKMEGIPMIKTEEQRGIKRIIKIQLTVIAVIITVGGTIHGINTGIWSDVLVTVIMLLILTSFFGLLTYMAALNRLGIFSDNISSELREKAFEIPVNARDLNGSFHYYDQCISEDN